MSLPNIPVPQFPDVPNLPGVPPLVRYALNTVLGDPAAPVALTGDDPSVTGQDTPPVWGIFDSDNNLVIQPDSIVEVGPTKEYRLLDYPVEDGSFQTYNKVEMPLEAHLVMTKSGSVSDRTTFLAQVDQIAGDLNLYSIVTPEETYTNVNILRRALDRTAQKGATLLTVELLFREIRVTATGTLSNTVSPTSQGQKNDGTVQATTPTPAQTSAAQGVQ